jgi:hypothetical protein
MRVRASHERVVVRARTRDRFLQQARDELREGVRHERPHEDLRPPQDERRRRGDREPDRAVAPDVGEPLEDRVEKAGAVSDLPPFELPVPADDG